MKTLFICAAAILLCLVFPPLAVPVGLVFIVLAIIGFVKAAND